MPGKGHGRCRAGIVRQAEGPLLRAPIDRTPSPAGSVKDSRSGSDAVRRNAAWGVVSLRDRELNGQAVQGEDAPRNPRARTVARALCVQRCPAGGRKDGTGFRRPSGRRVPRRVRFVCMTIHPPSATHPGQRQAAGRRRSGLRRAVPLLAAVRPSGRQRRICRIAGPQRIAETVHKIIRPPGVPRPD